MHTLRLGLDIGSTTIKAAMFDDNDELVYCDYRRHNADIQIELAKIFGELAEAFPKAHVRPCVTGSAGLGVAQMIDVPFVQEVIAGTAAINAYQPAADVVIELGGEDAKITYLHPMPEQRMNGTCAGGTGAFIDQMATLLHTDAAGLNALASRYTRLYPIASRCGVFAKSDLQPLINEGAPREDLAASIFQAVATQTIAGLACGRPIRGQVVFLGGPLHFLPGLRAAFERSLAEKVDEFVVPEQAHLYVAFGAALDADGEAVPLAELADRLASRPAPLGAAARMPVLFADEADRQEFVDRHARASVPIRPLAEAEGACFLGIDAGSTTIKAVVIDADRNIVFSHYASNRGDPVAAAIDIVRKVRRGLPGRAVLARACVTGYGEGLIRAALHVDEGEIETMAHYRAAEYVCPGVTSVIDIGGQDMKYLRVRDGALDSISVNEACSSGCGSFLQTFAETMNLDIESFADAALASYRPVDLGSRCTVFMNSSVKQAQKDGASVGDIAAGLSYAVVRNALFKVIKLTNAAQLGDKVVVQGGTFLNDAVLRSFELLTGIEVVRPDIAGLMGAFGAALVAQDRFVPGRASSVRSVAELKNLSIETTAKTCRLCQNHCQCTVSTFDGDEQYVTGNRCERGGDENTPKSTLPNLFEYKYKRLFGYRRLKEADAFRGDIGVPRVLNMFENYPFWFTVLTKLGFRVIVSGRSSHALFEQGMDSIASENVCYPAKLVHGHIVSLIERGVRTIFYPSVTYEHKLVEGADNHYNCPVVASYPQVIAGNVAQLRERDVRLIHPFFNLADRDVLVRRMVEEFADYAVTEEEAAAAVDAGYAEDAAAKADVRAAGRDAVEYLRRTGGTGIVLAGRPYHVDPEVHHGIPELINGLGMAVLTEDSVLGLDEVGARQVSDPDHGGEGGVEQARGAAGPVRPLRVRDQWAYHSRLYAAATVVADHPELELVQLNSFGCGLDAITTDQVAEILRERQKVYTTLKIDEVSNLGAARIRLRSLQAAVAERAGRVVAERAGRVVAPTEPVGPPERAVFTKEMKKAKHTIIAPQMSPVHFRLLEAAFRVGGYRVEILEHADASDVDSGLMHVNNDACYPAIMVVGQLINAFVSGRYDPDATSILITQTGGMCRATNYTSLLRKGLRDAGYPQVPVIAMSTGGLEKNPGFTLSPMLAHRAMQAVALGDLLQDMVLRVRPYEVTAGSTMALYRKWNAITSRFLASRRPTSYRKLVDAMVADFDALPIRSGDRLPRVGVVGEILVKFHPDANNHLIDVIEAEGCEAVLPGLMEFVLNGMYVAEWNYENLGVGKSSLRMKIIARKFIERYRRPIRRAVARTHGKFHAPGEMADLVARATEVTSLGNQAGEGWLLTAEILELIADGVPNVVCAQPFACLPNHVTGKGMFREIRRHHPEANIVAVDYDPGASEVNQLNRIKLMIANARRGPADDRRAASRARREPMRTLHDPVRSLPIAPANRSASADCCSSDRPMPAAHSDGR